MAGEGRPGEGVSLWGARATLAATSENRLLNKLGDEATSWSFCILEGFSQNLGITQNLGI